MPWVRGGNAEQLAPGLNHFTFDKLRERPSQMIRYNLVRSSTRAWEDTYETAGFGPLIKKGELNPTSLDEPLKLGGVRFVHDSFALGFLVSEEMRDDEMYGMTAKLAGSLGRSARITTELYGHDLLNNAFSGAKYVGRDGLSLCNSAHPLKGSSTTFSNIITVSADLSEAALETAITSFDNMVDDRNITVEMSPSILLVTVADRMLAKRLLKSEKLPGAGTGGFTYQPNDINPLYDEGVVPMVSQWLNGVDEWFLIANPSESPLQFWWRKTPDTKTWDDDNADGTYHKIKQRHSNGFDDWRGIFGSQG